MRRRLFLLAVRFCVAPYRVGSPVVKALIADRDRYARPLPGEAPP